MPTKAQSRPAYHILRAYLRRIREEAGLSQRALGALLKKPQSWIYNCETGYRRVDVLEFAAWVKACGDDPKAGLGKLLKEVG